MNDKVLTEGSNLLDIYMAHAGISEVPALFHKWCLYSLVAATAGDRVGYKYMPEATTVPSIYTFLVGPSGWGKNESIGAALKFTDTLDAVKSYSGRFSGPALVRLIGAAQGEGKPGEPTPKLWLVTPELGMSIGEGPKAIDTIKIVTELFSMAGKNQILKDSTLTYGQAVVEKPCLNWLAGTTVKWLKRSVSHDDIEAGFGSRVFMIYVDIDENVERCVRPRMRQDYWQLRGWLDTRLQAITQLSGEFRMTQAAAQVEETWYMTRPGPQSALLAAWWKREKELCLKMAMILSLCDREDLVITDSHIAQAQAEVAFACNSLVQLVTTAGISEDWTGAHKIENAIRRVGVMSHQRLMRLALQEGLTAERLASVLRSLVEADKVHALDRKERVLPGWRGDFYVHAQRADSMPVFDTVPEEEAVAWKH